MRIIIAFLITILSGIGMGYRVGYSSAVQDHIAASKPQRQPWEFDDYYADPATRPTITTKPVHPRRPPPAPG